MSRREAMADSSHNQGAGPGSPAPAPPCRHLRSNGMYVFDDRAVDSEDDDYEPSGFWCLQTMKPFGPDDDRVGRRDCRQPDRSCYEPL